MGLLVDDGIAGDYYYDMHGDGTLSIGEPGLYGFGNSVFEDFGLDGFKYYQELDPDDDGHYGQSMKIQMVISFQFLI